MLDPPLTYKLAPPNLDCAVLMMGLPVIVATLPVPELSVSTVLPWVPSKWNRATVPVVPGVCASEPADRSTVPSAFGGRSGVVSGTASGAPASVPTTVPAASAEFAEVHDPLLDATT